ncbi:hypothetical protein FK268_22525 [Tsukamurella sputi]|uniref:Uncharacterized protein n=1 Tax=Tsukamurella sputi TaxID=2591848 RepID=A0A5C5RFD3_9ACTN|nr:hypothetical protein [Tsukamurella sputi]TWS21819.1 hypothetical protein FK268_22525 [Tsukamurella sputi]
MSDPNMMQQRAVIEVSAQDFQEARNAINALDGLGFDMKREKDEFNALRAFLGEVAQVSNFRATELKIKDVIREASEPDPARIRAVGDRLVSVRLRELRDGLAVHGEEAANRIDAERLALHQRHEALRGTCAHLTADDAISVGLVDQYREFRSLAAEWEQLRRDERALLNANAIPSEGAALDGLAYRRYRKGHVAFAQRSGQLDLHIEDRPASELYAEAARALGKVDASVAGVDLFSPKNDGGGIGPDPEGPRERPRPFG